MGRLAGRLDQLEIDAGDRVMAIADKSPEALCLYLACLRMGAVFVPVNPALRSRELSYVVADADSKLIVCRPDIEDRLREMIGVRDDVSIRTLDAHGQGSFMTATEHAVPPPLVSSAADDVAVMLYTSGTTGRPKGAMLTHGNLSSNARALVDAWGFSADDVLLHALPLFHVHGLFVASHCALAVSAKMMFLPTFDLDVVLEALPRVSVMMGVPTFYFRLLGRTELSKHRCAGMRLFTSGSAPLSAETFAAFEERTGHPIVERYGMTETLISTTNPIDGRRRPGSVGFPLENVEIRINEESELEVRGPNVFSGYFGQPERTAAAFCDDGFFKTGDVARFDDDGSLVLTGRATDVIISGGENVYPREVEIALEEIEGVAEVVVFGVPHADLGEAVTALVVPATDPLNEASINRCLEVDSRRTQGAQTSYLRRIAPTECHGQGRPNRAPDAVSVGLLTTRLLRSRVIYNIGMNSRAPRPLAGDEPRFYPSDQPCV